MPSAREGRARSEQERQRQQACPCRMCKEGARARAGTPYLLLTAARVSSITRHRAAVLRVMQGEARAARAGEAFCAVRVVCCCAVCMRCRRDPENQVSATVDETPK